MTQLPLHLRIGLRRPSGQGRRPDLRRRARRDPRAGQARARRLRNHGQDRRGDRRRRNHHQRVDRPRGAHAQGRSSTSATTTPKSASTARTCGVLNLIGKQSPDINQGVDRKKPEEQGAGDQGLMFGYATNETRELHAGGDLSTRTASSSSRRRCARQESPLPWLRPDAKSQVTLRYDNGKAVGDRRGRAVDAARSGRQAEGPDRSA